MRPQIQPRRWYEMVTADLFKLKCIAYPYKLWCVRVYLCVRSYIHTYIHVYIKYTSITHTQSTYIVLHTKLTAYPPNVYYSCTLLLSTGFVPVISNYLLYSVISRYPHQLASNHSVTVARKQPPQKHL